MPDLTPMTRQEKFLNGDTDLEPITRREHFYAGREGELPEGHQEPETREEWFIKKYREAGDVTVEEITITENGTTTAPSGKAYSPIHTNVPLPENAYLLKSVTTPTPIASFTDGEEMVMPSLKVAIEPQQEGSGDPSPTNIRPISGWSNCVISVANAITDPTVEHTYTIDLDGTRYGGTLDVVSGVLTVDRVIKTFTESDLWVISSNNAYLSVPDGDDGKIISDILEYGDYSGNAKMVGSNHRFYVWDAVNAYNITTREEAQSFFKDHTVVYYIATPLTIQLTPTQVKSLLGSNNVWADTGDITDAEYFSKEV